LSCILFNIELGAAGIETEGTTDNKTIHIHAYADDTVLVGRTTGVLKEVIIILSEAAQQIGLKIKDTEV
jgi:hypothetical protein